MASVRLTGVSRCAATVQSECRPEALLLNTLAWYELPLWEADRWNHAESRSKAYDVCTAQNMRWGDLNSNTRVNTSLASPDHNLCYRYGAGSGVLAFTLWRRCVPTF